MDEMKDETRPSDITIITTGIALGFVHVLTGPDHMSALATLSASISDRCASFTLGVKWGFGHSFGLLLVGIILLIRDWSSNNAYVEVPDEVSHFFESLVGVFMLVLGVFGFRRAFRKRHEYQGRLPIDDEDDDTVNEISQGLQSKPRIPYEPGISYHDDPLDTFVEELVADEGDDIDSTFELEQGQSRSIFSFSRRLSTQTVAFFAGIVHGLAGPGGVLGVIPAVQLHDVKLALMYLSAFCFSAIITMGCFAVFYGTLTSTVGRKMNLEFHIHCFSAGLSILVGITWLVLLSIGKLEDVFP